ncbi:RNA-directed DNA polymerase [Purpureocillium takamizusanense]|uniref:Telomerase reverse transcriptase n=1 Tax=Purpureocillium takamizusanense TaxID=2060973 RepID=A0A9Q8QHJ9_9HYPO|nr:RNA-directed DNA polymerase [Purpureocillium takamizusanense]UNI21054.1 RNA-directed DNA polymerase [Purpureocillium takamizusanense]
MSRGMKRKRAHHEAEHENNKKENGRGANDASRNAHSQRPHAESPVSRDLLKQYYPKVQTLRDYVLCRLPGTSRLRRKKITSLGNGPQCGEVEPRLAGVLDSTLVCSRDEQAGSKDEKDSAYKQYLSFSQRGDESCVTLTDATAGAYSVQAEIVDFVIWLLFRRQGTGADRPKHILCDGYIKGANAREAADSGIHNICRRHPNSHVDTLKQAPWTHLLVLLGKSGEEIMVNLLVGCSVFSAVEAGLGNYYQLSGLPLSELDLSKPASALAAAAQTEAKRASDIIFVRSRIFYAKPAITAQGRVHIGFKHIHVLNRCRYARPLSRPGDGPSPSDVERTKHNDAKAIKVMMYMFPRQFGLHNVFTSDTNRWETTQRFQDYTLRETEIAGLLEKHPKHPSLQGSPHPKIPKRLRGAPLGLVRKLQVLHHRCSYTELLRHHCPTFLDGRRRSRGDNSQFGAAMHGTLRPSHSADRLACQAGRRAKRRTRNAQPSSQVHLPSSITSFVELASPVPQVSAFCQAALSKLIPSGFWGEGDTMYHNKTTFLRSVDRFIKLRRFESMTLHDIAQGLRVADLDWLQPPGQQGRRQCQSDTNKRLEIFLEFLYYVFDSLLIPLIRTNFYVTESNTHRYQVFYFRHDVWRLVAEPAMAGLKRAMFEELPTAEARQLLDVRKLGFSQIRLLPKGKKMRPIMNLRRKQLSRTSSKILGPSINSVLGPVHTVLKFEKDTNPLKLGSTLFSVSDMYTRLKRFKKLLGCGQRQLYFAKVDVRAAFDTIPQAAVVNLMSTVPLASQYNIMKHAEVLPGERTMAQPDKPATKPMKRWRAVASPSGAFKPFSERVEDDLARAKKHTVFVDTVFRKSWNAQTVLQLLTQHVEQNVVKVGKKFYRQKTGIPQGSVLSSFLCNYFYADLEAQHLGFLDTPDCLVMRLIDDFLVITLDKSKAIRFVEVMHRGLPEYGVGVSREKTLVNFDVTLADGAVARVSDGAGFPYCGTRIDCRTLDITKDRSRDEAAGIVNSLTVEYGRSPGQNFQRKILNAFKIQSHLMFYDTAHNSTATVLQSLHDAFRGTARKMWAYVRCLPRHQQPNAGLIMRESGSIGNALICGELPFLD